MTGDAIDLGPERIAFGTPGRSIPIIAVAKTEDCDCPLYPGCKCPACNTCDELLKGEPDAPEPTV